MTIQAAHAVHGHRQPARHGGGPTTALLVGGLCGLAWAAGLRGFMAQIAGTASGVDWAGTFAWILLSGRGPRWARTLSGAAALTAIPIWALTVTSFAGPGLALDTPRGAWVAVYYWSLLAVLMLACAIPHRAATPTGSCLSPMEHVVDKRGALEAGNRAHNCGTGHLHVRVAEHGRLSGGARFPR